MGYIPHTQGEFTETLTLVSNGYEWTIKQIEVSGILEESCYGQLGRYASL